MTNNFYRFVATQGSTGLQIQSTRGVKLVASLLSENKTVVWAKEVATTMFPLDAAGSVTIRTLLVSPRESSLLVQIEAKAPSPTPTLDMDTY